MAQSQAPSETIAAQFAFLAARIEDPSATMAFSSEMETGSREENASNQESRAAFQFNRNGKDLWQI